MIADSLGRRNCRIPNVQATCLNPTRLEQKQAERLKTERNEPCVYSVPMSENPIANMRARAEQCRRLSKATHDNRAAGILHRMADEIEADIRPLNDDAEAQS